MLLDPYVTTPDDTRLCIPVRPGMPLPVNRLVACSDPLSGNAFVGWLVKGARNTDGTLGRLRIMDDKAAYLHLCGPQYLRVIDPSLSRLRVGQRVRHHRKGTIYVITALLNRRGPDTSHFPHVVAYVEEGGDPAEAWCKPVDRFFATMLPVDMKE